MGPSNELLATYSLSSDILETDVSQVHLGSHSWLNWTRLYVSPIMIVVHARSIEGKIAVEQYEHNLSLLRDELCDLCDALSAYGYQTPLTLLVECDELNYPQWHEMAGNQDSLRGAFSIQPFTKSRFARANIVDAETLTSLLIDATAIHVHAYKLKSLTDREYLESVARRVEEEPDRAVLTRQLGLRVLKAYNEDGILRAGGPIGTTVAQRGASEWLRYDVVAPAERLLTSTSGDRARSLE
ncbi:hypothetical protein SAMN02787142_2236 [Burkholderia sp. WP9]|uniref:hypothetical protein n=1 Tax=Burkholderia sp. WP9 TaxID=1500263 RepID=UPI00089D2F5F|nr:hypothetical protein [Burkholderia sp. WP9]SEC94786.1 hypothetical protein SAMN02787142_2236 [Burkholderia sp. WP9]